MKLTHEILRHLIENKDEEFTIRQISKIFKKDYKNVYDAVQKIAASISAVKKSNSTYLNFLPVLTNDVFAVEMQRRAEMLKNPGIRLIFNDLKRIENPLFAAVVFGSYAKNENTKHSDIDICIIHDNPEEGKKIRAALSVHPRIEIHEFTSEEFVSMLKEKPFNVGHEIVKHGVVLHNIEAYYEMMKYE